MTALKLMILTFTFYKIGDKIPQNNFDELENPDIFEKQFLQNVIKEHPLWNIEEFWEAAIFSSIKEELKSQKKYLFGHDESSDDTLIREKNIMFGQLASYCNNMLMFHIEKNVVKEIIGNFCKFFNLFEPQIKELNVKIFEKDFLLKSDFF